MKKNVPVSIPLNASACQAENEVLESGSGKERNLTMANTRGSSLNHTTLRRSACNRTRRRRMHDSRTGAGASATHRLLRPAIRAVAVHPPPPCGQPQLGARAPCLA